MGSGTDASILGVAACVDGISVGLAVPLGTPKKTVLDAFFQKFCPQRKPFYETRIMGESHSPFFACDLSIPEVRTVVFAVPRKSFYGTGTRKRDAETEAASKALDHLHQHGVLGTISFQRDGDISVASTQPAASALDSKGEPSEPPPLDPGTPTINPVFFARSQNEQIAMQNLHDIANRTYSVKDTLLKTALTLGGDLQRFSRSQLDESPEDLQKRLRDFDSLLDKLIEQGPEEGPRFEDNTISGVARDDGNDSMEASFSFGGQLEGDTHSSPE